jgi:hypothetical protein
MSASSGVYINDKIAESYLTKLGIDFNQPQNLTVHHTSIPRDPDWLMKFDQRVSDQKIVFCSELHATQYQELLTLDQPGIDLHICGVINHKFHHARVFRWMIWFDTTAKFYRLRPKFLTNLLRPHEVKPLSFDILLGSQRNNRDYVYNYITDRGLESHVFRTYFRTWNPESRDVDQLIPERGIEYLPEYQFQTGTVQHVQYYDAHLSLSQIVPVSIYNLTAYTLVTETNGINEFNFYTEKIVKPILAHRLFIVIAGRHYLRNLRALGFRTFDGIIDESYDEVSDDYERYRQAMTQVEWLCHQPQQPILDRIAEITQHNCRLMLDTNWHTLDWPGY